MKLIEDPSLATSLIQAPYAGLSYDDAIYGMDPFQNSYGDRLFPTVVDQIANADPDKAFVLLPKTLDPVDGFTTVTYGMFARGVDRCAYWIISELGVGKTFDTLSFMGHARDFRYPIFLLAAVKAGYKAQFVSPKNSLSAHISLLDTTSCQIMVLDEQPLPIVSEILEHRLMKTLRIPALEVLLRPHEPSDKPFPYTKTFAEARFEPLVVLQTSGSTGTPKAITATHGTFAAMDAHHDLPELSGECTVCDLFRDSRWAMMFPFFHTGAYLFLFGYSIYYNITSVLAPRLVPSPQLLDSLHEHGECNSAILPPSLIYPIFELPEGRARLSAMKFVAYAGGPLPRRHGDIMSANVRLVNLLGSTETAMYPIVVHDVDWEYIKYDDHLGHEFRHHGDDLYELVIVKQKALNQFQGVFCTFPELDEYHTRELYQKHPTREGYWRNAGRVDDVIAFSNGEKFNPVDLENTVSGHPAVLSCIATGRGRFQSSLIIESQTPPKSDLEEAELLEQLWPTIDQANTTSIATGRITRDLVLFAKSDRPFPRTEKGTIKRVLTEELYQADLDNLYSNAGDINGSLYSQISPEERSMESFEPFLLELIRDRSRKVEAEPVDEFSQIGLDSIQFASIVRDINIFVVAAGRPDLKIDISILYLNSSVSKILTYFHRRLESLA